MSHDLFKVLRATIRLGRRRQDRYHPDKVIYTLESLDLADPYTHMVAMLVLSSYQAMQEAHADRPLAVHGLETLPRELRTVVVSLIQKPPLSHLFPVVDVASSDVVDVRLLAVISPTVLPSLAAG